MRQCLQYPRRNRSPPFRSKREASFVKRTLNKHILRSSAHTEIRFTLHEERFILDTHATAPVKGMPH